MEEIRSFFYAQNNEKADPTTII